MKSSDLPTPPPDADVLDYQSSSVGPNRKTFASPPEKSDAENFKVMAYWLVGFLICGAILAFAKWISTPTP